MSTTPKILEKPVHVAVLKPSPIQKITHTQKLKAGGVVQSTPAPVDLPVVKKKSTKFNPMAGLNFTENNPAKQALRKTRLTVLHSQVPPLAPDQVPPCSSCKTSPCCTAFVVSITQEEYNSGLYGDYAVEITAKQAQQLRGKLLLPLTASIPMIHAELKNDLYFLEGRTGESCHFLQADGGCGIYDTRPLVCRVYSCVDDPRITQEMRDGIEEDKE